MIQINLIPDIKQEFLNAQRTRNIVVSSAIIAGVAAVIVVVIALVTLGGQHLLDKAADDEIDKWDEKINDHIIYLLLLRAIVDETNYGEDD